MFANVFSCQICSFGNQAKSTLNDCQHRPLRACRPVEDRIRSLPMTETSGVWAKRICRAVIGKRSKAKSVLGGDFFLFVTFSFWSHRKKKYIRRCKRHVYKKNGQKGYIPSECWLSFSAARKRMNMRGCPGTVPAFCPHRKKKYIRQCKRHVYRMICGSKGYSLTLRVARKRMNNRGCPGTVPAFCPHRKNSIYADVNGIFTKKNKKT